MFHLQRYANMYNMRISNVTIGALHENHITTPSKIYTSRVMITTFEHKIDNLEMDKRTIVCNTQNIVF